MIVVENHSEIGGLGEAVARLLMREKVHPAFDHNRAARCVPRCRCLADAA